MLINKQNEDKKHKFEIKSKTFSNPETLNQKKSKIENKNQNEDGEKIEEQEQNQEQNSKILLMSEENIPYMLKKGNIVRI